MKNLASGQDEKLVFGIYRNDPCFSVNLKLIHNDHLR